MARAGSLLGHAKRVNFEAVGQTIELPRTRDPGSGLGGEWRGVVRNDDHNTFDHRAHTPAPLVPRITPDVGYAIADPSHNPRPPLLWSGPPEPPQPYLGQLCEA